MLFLIYVCHTAIASRAHVSQIFPQTKHIFLNHSDYPLHTFYFTAFCLLLLICNLALLSQNYHVFGTDKVGQDVLYQSLKSIRTGLVIGTLTTLVMLPMAIMLGIAAGYFRGWIDDLIQYIYTTLNSIPGVLLIAAAVLILQVYMNNHPENFKTIAERADIRLLFLCIILGMTSWTGLCRILRAETLKLREAEYVMASRALGAGSFSILRKPILPNLMHLVLISVVLKIRGRGVGGGVEGGQGGGGAGGRVGAEKEGGGGGGRWAEQTGKIPGGGEAMGGGNGKGTKCRGGSERRDGGRRVAHEMGSEA